MRGCQITWKNCDGMSCTSDYCNDTIYSEEFFGECVEDTSL